MTVAQTHRAPPAAAQDYSCALWGHLRLSSVDQVAGQPPLPMARWLKGHDWGEKLARLTADLAHQAAWSSTEHGGGARRICPTMIDVAMACDRLITRADGLDHLAISFPQAWVLADPVDLDRVILLLLRDTARAARKWAELDVATTPDGALYIGMRDDRGFGGAGHAGQHGAMRAASPAPSSPTPSNMRPGIEQSRCPARAQNVMRYADDRWAYHWRRIDGYLMPYVDLDPLYSSDPEAQGTISLDRATD